MKTKPEWWPQNPYPSDIFTATIEDYKKVIPDENTRTAISGYLGRRFWELASDAIWEAIESSGEAEVGDEEIEKLAEEILIYFYGEFDDSGKEAVIGMIEPKIRALLRQRRTVNLDQLHKWASFDWGNSYEGTVYNIREILAELGIPISEEKERA